MSYLSEDPWPLVILLGALAAGFLVALRVTQDGKYLVRAGVAVGLALLVLAIEQFWVTDAERIEAVVTDLSGALLASDADRILLHFAPEVDVTLDDKTLGTVDPSLIRRQLQDVEFTRVFLTRLKAEASTESRRGKATFGAVIMGTNHNLTVHPTFGGSTEWDLGFEETAPGVWKVSRITPMNLHPAARLALQGAMRIGGGRSRRP